ncbi:MAG: amidase, partial [Gammaproteobacteria bacterium]|nr:amidase [Gammaproteobacteria bacterium]
MNELYRWSARELIQHLKDGSISSEEATRVLLARIERVNPTLNAVVTLDAERALRDARAADQERAQGKLRGPLHGLPMTLKDTWEVTGMRTTAGAPSLSGHIPARDADLVARLRAAGVIILGKTNVPYFASDVQTYNRIFGVTHNPWSRQHTCGGSS